MKIACPSCNKEYNIPDERIPKDRGIAFPCPACKETINIDLRAGAAAGEDNPSLSAKKGPGAIPATPETEGRDLPKGEALKNRILRTVKDLPPMPQTVLKAREIIGSRSSSFEDLAKVLETDQAIAAKVLRLSNSAYYGMVGKVSSLQHASVVLGMQTLEELITLAGSSNLLGNRLEGYELEAGDLWEHSLGVAFGSKIIANRKNPSLANDAFAAGLIHDAGKLALEPHLLERKEAFRAFLDDGEKSFLLAEKEILGFDHSEIAFELCKSWRVPQSLLTAVRYHHYPSHSNGDELAYVVHTADAIALMSGIGAGIDGMRYQIDNNALSLLGLGEGDISEILIEIVESVQKITEEIQEPVR